ncbi:hypothetical protein BESB_006890 [Besnoitia besnoiti]|uniref:Protein kinase domain-containing protein n=1 Tax=Besnoitia besnoiti TaxID=94643 RepID=A0A2A9MIJ0_BESBE|nr:hypothetical protein BESB_006890 [Besnoitia besnoiti]PFH38348.1 hypothetical protein BESB_006890 [Besnoitia besnoiti]
MTETSSRVSSRGRRGPKIASSSSSRRAVRGEEKADARRSRAIRRGVAAEARGAEGDENEPAAPPQEAGEGPRRRRGAKHSSGGKSSPSSVVSSGCGSPSSYAVEGLQNRPYAPVPSFASSPSSSAPSSPAGRHHVPQRETQARIPRVETGEACTGRLSTPDASPSRGSPPPWRVPPSAPSPPFSASFSASSLLPQNRQDLLLSPPAHSTMAARLKGAPSLQTAADGGVSTVGFEPTAFLGAFQNEARGNFAPLDSAQSLQETASQRPSMLVRSVGSRAPTFLRPRLLRPLLPPGAQSTDMEAVGVPPGSTLGEGPDGRHEEGDDELPPGETDDDEAQANMKAMREARDGARKGRGSEETGGSRPAGRRVGFASLRTFDKTNKVFQLSAEEEASLLRLAEQQHEHLFADESKRRWLQQWVEPSQSGVPGSSGLSLSGRPRPTFFISPSPVWGAPLPALAEELTKKKLPLPAASKSVRRLTPRPASLVAASQAGETLPGDAAAAVQPPGPAAETGGAPAPEVEPIVGLPEQKRTKPRVCEEVTPWIKADDEAEAPTATERVVEDGGHAGRRGELGAETDGLVADAEIAKEARPSQPIPGRPRRVTIPKGAFKSHEAVRQGQAPVVLRLFSSARGWGPGHSPPDADSASAPSSPSSSPPPSDAAASQTPAFPSSVSPSSPPSPGSVVVCAKLDATGLASPSSSVRATLEIKAPPPRPDSGPEVSPPLSSKGAAETRARLAGEPGGNNVLIEEEACAAGIDTVLEAAEEETEVARERKLMLFICNLEQAISQWAAAATLCHHTLVPAGEEPTAKSDDPEEGEAAGNTEASSPESQAKRVPSGTRNRSIRQSGGRSPPPSSAPLPSLVQDAKNLPSFWRAVLPVKPVDMPLEEFVVWCQRPFGMDVREYLRLLASGKAGEVDELQLESAARAPALEGEKEAEPSLLSVVPPTHPDASSTAERLSLAPASPPAASHPFLQPRTFEAASSVSPRSQSPPLPRPQSSSSAVSASSSSAVSAARGGSDAFSSARVWAKLYSWSERNIAALAKVLDSYVAFDEERRRALKKQRLLQRQFAIYNKLCTTMRRNFTALLPRQLRTIRAGMFFTISQSALSHGRLLNLVSWQPADAQPLPFSSLIFASPSASPVSVRRRGRGELPSEEGGTVADGQKNEKEESRSEAGRGVPKPRVEDSENERKRRRKTVDFCDVLQPRAFSPAASSASRPSAGNEGDAMPTPLRTTKGARLSGDRILHQRGLVAAEYYADREALLREIGSSFPSLSVTDGQREEEGARDAFSQAFESRAPGAAHTRVGNVFYYQRALDALERRFLDMNGGAQRQRDRQQATAEFGLFPPAPGEIPRGCQVWRCLSLTHSSVLWLLFHEASASLLVMRVSRLQPHTQIRTLLDLRGGASAFCRFLSSLGLTLPSPPSAETGRGSAEASSAVTAAEGRAERGGDKEGILGVVSSSVRDETNVESSLSGHEQTLIREALERALATARRLEAGGDDAEGPRSRRARASEGKDHERDDEGDDDAPPAAGQKTGSLIAAKDAYLVGDQLVEIAPHFEDVSLAEHLEKHGVYKGERDVQRVRQIAFLLTRLVEEAPDRSVLLPLKTSRVYLRQRRLALYVGVPASAACAPFSSFLADRGPSGASSASPLPPSKREASAERAGKDAKSNQGEARVVDRMPRGAARSEELAYVLARDFGLALLDALRRPTVASALGWTESLESCLPPECFPAERLFLSPGKAAATPWTQFPPPPSSLSLPLYPTREEDVSKAHTWMLGVLLYRILCGEEKKSLSVSKEPEFTSFSDSDSACAFDLSACADQRARSFLAFCLNPDPRRRPLVAELRRHPFLAELAEAAQRRQCLCDAEKHALSSLSEEERDDDRGKSEERARRPTGSGARHKGREAADASFSALEYGGSFDEPLQSDESGDDGDALLEPNASAASASSPAACGVLVAEDPKGSRTPRARPPRGAEGAVSEARESGRAGRAPGGERTPTRSEWRRRKGSCSSSDASPVASARRRRSAGAAAALRDGRAGSLRRSRVASFSSFSLFSPHSSAAPRNEDAREGRGAARVEVRESESAARRLAAERGEGEQRSAESRNRGRGAPPATDHAAGGAREPSAHGREDTDEQRGHAEARNGSSPFRKSPRSKEERCQRSAVARGRDEEGRVEGAVQDRWRAQTKLDAAGRGNAAGEHSPQKRGQGRLSDLSSAASPTKGSRLRRRSQVRKDELPEPAEAEREQTRRASVRMPAAGSAQRSRRARLTRASSYTSSPSPSLSRRRSGSLSERKNRREREREDPKAAGGDTRGRLSAMRARSSSSSFYAKQEDGSPSPQRRKKRGGEHVEALLSRKQRERGSGRNTRLLACCEALFGDVERMVPELIGRQREGREEDGVAFYGGNDPLRIGFPSEDDEDEDWQEGPHDDADEEDDQAQEEDEEEEDA